MDAVELDAVKLSRLSHVAWPWLDGDRTKLRQLQQLMVLHNWKNQLHEAIPAGHEDRLHPSELNQEIRLHGTKKN